MKKITLILICFFCINSAYAAIEKASIVFTAGLNEITNKHRGGYAELASLLAIQRKKSAPSFFIFGGDSLFPSVLSSFDNGTHIIDLLNSLEPDVMAASKGDFVFSEDELSLRTYEAAFPIVQSNIISKSTKDNLDGVLDSVIMEQGTYKFGFISLMDKIAIERYNLTQVEIKDPSLVIAAEAAKLRKNGADFIIMHYPGDTLNCIDFLNDHSVDLVLRKNDRLKLMAESKLQKHPRQIFLTEPGQVAIIEMSWLKDKPETLDVKWEANRLIYYPASPKLQEQIDGYTSQLNLLLDEIIAVTTTEIDISRVSVRTKENAIGNLVADLILKHSNADIALINGGGIRGDHVFPPNSKITQRDIIEIFPYRDTVVLLEISGAQLIAALENGFSQIENLDGRFPQVSGMKVVYDPLSPASERVISVTINKLFLEPTKLYKLATSSFLAKGGDGYIFFKENKILSYDQQMSKILSDILVNELRSTNMISPKVESRIVDIAKERVE